MTIAACYLSPEGVVLGADSTTTIGVDGPDGFRQHHYEYGQKIFEIGAAATLGITMWGLGSLGPVSYRTLIADLADDLAATPPPDVEDVARRWMARFWSAYSAFFAPLLQAVQTATGKPEDQRTDEDKALLERMDGFAAGGFCIGGNCRANRTPRAFEITYDLLGGAQSKEIQVGGAKFWGVPNSIDRLIYGVDFGFLVDILNSGKWSGTPDELRELLGPYIIRQPSLLPLREAIDLVHGSIYATIKAMKFSHLAPVCGGPIEVAVITTDRPFRWVRHKAFDAAIGHAGPREV